jgi:pimeloyl-ACP methyl ester carboxylesterase
MSALQANGIMLEYESLGDEGAPVIVLIAGLGMQLTAWPMPFCQALAAAGYRVIRFDNRDSGLSTRIDTAGLPNIGGAFTAYWMQVEAKVPYRVADMAEDTTGLMDALDIRQAHVVGASMGGMIAQTLAAQHPDRVVSLTSIMSNTGDRRLSIGSPEPNPAVLARLPDPKDLNVALEHLVGVLGVVAGPGIPVGPEDLRRRVEHAVGRSYDPAGTARQLAAVVASGDRSLEVATIRVPTLVLHGDADPLVPIAAGEETAARIPARGCKSSAAWVTTCQPGRAWRRNHISLRCGAGGDVAVGGRRHHRRGVASRSGPRS